MKQVYIAQDPPDAHLLAGILEQYGFSCELMSRTLITGLVFSAVTILAVLAISPAKMHPGGFNAAQAAGASETGIVAERQESWN